VRSSTAAPCGMSPGKKRKSQGADGSGKSAKHRRQSSVSCTDEVRPLVLAFSNARSRAEHKDPNDVRCDVSKSQLRDPELYRFRSPPVGRRRSQQNEIFLSGSCRFVGVLERARRVLFDKQYNTFTLHATGRAMERAIRACLVLVERYGTWLTYSVQTSSVPLLDEYEPRRQNLPWIQQTRLQSAIHIEIIKTKRLPVV
jgi:hypothetical protein